MKKIFEVLEKVQDVSGSLEKIRLLSESFDKDFAEFFELFYADINYNLSKRSWEKIVGYTKKKDGTYDDAGQLVSRYSTGSNGIDKLQFYKLINDVEKLSGNELLEHCLNNILCYDSLSVKWIVRFLNKDLRIGLNLKPINKILQNKGFPKIEKFGVQLCGKFDDIHQYDIEFPCMASIKYDGFRCIAEKDNDTVILKSRQGKIIDFVPEIVEEIKKLPYDKIILDGEIMAKDFNAIQKRIGRKVENIEIIEDLHYRLFDVLKIETVNYEELYTQEIRQKWFEEEFTETPLLRKEYSICCNNREELINFYKKVIDDKQEGVIIKLLNRKYVRDSRDNWYKVKKVSENTFKVVGYEYGTGKYKDVVSKLKISDDGGQVNASVGSGVTLNDIEEFKFRVNNNVLINSYVDIKYMELTKNESGYSLRHPVFLKFRDDKNKTDEVIKDGQKNDESSIFE